MQEFDIIPGGEVLPRTCWVDGDACGASEAVPGGITLSFLVERDTFAPLLVHVHHFPAGACPRCGNVTYDGPLAVAVERALAARYEREGELPPELEFERTRAA
jgi:hypothetical protein